MSIFSRQNGQGLKRPPPGAPLPRIPRLRSRVCVPPRCFATYDSCVLATPGSERNVVVRAAPGGHRRLGEVRGIRGNVALRREATAVLATLAGAEELHGIGNDIYRLPLLSALVLPFAPLEAPVDRDRTALRQVLSAVLALRAPYRDVEVVRLVDPLPRLVLPARVHRHAETADRGAASGVPELRVTCEVARDDHAVQVRCCHEAAFLLSCSKTSIETTYAFGALGGGRPRKSTKERLLSRSRYMGNTPGCTSPG